LPCQLSQSPIPQPTNQPPNHSATQPLNHPTTQLPNHSTTCTYVADHGGTGSKCIVKVDSTSCAVKNNVAVERRVVGSSLEEERRLLVDDTDLVCEIAENQRAARLIAGRGIPAETRVRRVAVVACGVTNQDYRALSQPHKLILGDHRAAVVPAQVDAGIVEPCERGAADLKPDRPIGSDRGVSVDLRSTIIGG
jgi:hypothetical protein